MLSLEYVRMGPDKSNFRQSRVDFKMYKTRCNKFENFLNAVFGHLDTLMA